MANFNLRTLEEEFRAIGLVRESRQAAGKQEEREPEGGEGIEGIEEGFKIVKKVKGALARMMKRLRHKKYMKTRGKAKVAARKYGAKASTKRRIKKRLAFKKRRGIKGGTNKIVRMDSIGRVANLIEEVQGIVSGIAGRQDRELVKGFANMALIADTLAERFSGVAEEVDDEGKEQLSGLAAAFAELAEDAAAVAEGLDGGHVEADGDLEEMFRSDMEDLLDGLELYDEMTEEDDGDGDDEGNG